ncbi:oxidoreductase [Pseudoclavibacter endophyticus]|uniref:NAD(P)/FAD-dependent oxidoreductase n=1 Tax=Pseudoclavibacter endophyticus TaxID=1778590 RepID=A0A6H9WQB8_9MICO|nr:NAD(P)/FAD-dependent oxidoreductase [Pseudoclavibacter endophyticus]KAB1650328.1 NAD(P)/FAD-dependent oxidoreductase [Pseudoclavibacter endophyticus]GGA55112.1 oxidoreductase [Pseudoclavibacter endophyticus]
MTTVASAEPVRRAVVIGAGQAGLAAAHHLRRRGFTPGVDLEILDANPTPGGAWSHRWDALTFDDAHGIHDLPGFPVGEVDPSEPAREVVKRYYGDYEAREGLRVRRPVRVTAVERREGGGFLVRGVSRGEGGAVSGGSTADGAGGVTLGSERDAVIVISTDVVISATGTWDSPFVPSHPGRFEGRQLTTRDFVSPDELMGERVLVVGGGASAVQFVLLLEAHGVDTVWSTRRPPQWIDASFNPEWGRGVEERVRVKTHRGLPSGSVVSNTGLALLPRYRAGIERGVLVSRGPIRQLTSGGVDFADGSHEEVGAILWATGFRPSLGHLAPLRVREPGGGLLVGEDDVTVVREPGLFVVGYGASASTLGATRAGRRAALAAGRITAPAAA